MYNISFWSLQSFGSFVWRFWLEFTLFFHLDLFVCLRFCGPVNAIKVVLSWSVNLSTLFLGRLPKWLTGTKCPYFQRSALLKLFCGRERMAVKIISWPNRYKRYMARSRIEPATPCIPVKQCIRLSYHFDWKRLRLVIVKISSSRGLAWQQEGSVVVTSHLVLALNCSLGGDYGQVALTSSHLTYHVYNCAGTSPSLTACEKAEFSLQMAGRFLSKIFYFCTNCIIVLAQSEWANLKGP